jgi:hypothetical protein
MRTLFIDQNAIKKISDTALQIDELLDKINSKEVIIKISSAALIELSNSVNQLNEKLDIGFICPNENGDIQSQIDIFFKNFSILFNISKSFLRDKNLKSRLRRQKEFLPQKYYNMIYKSIDCASNHDFFAGEIAWDGAIRKTLECIPKEIISNFCFMLFKVHSGYEETEFSHPAFFYEMPLSRLLNYLFNSARNQSSDDNNLIKALKNLNYKSSRDIFDTMLTHIAAVGVCSSYDQQLEPGIIVTADCEYSFLLRVGSYFNLLNAFYDVYSHLTESDILPARDKMLGEVIFINTASNDVRHVNLREEFKGKLPTYYINEKNEVIAY